jgi:hypothetical protein
MLDIFRYAAQFGQEETTTASGLRAAIDAVKKELDSLFNAGRGACASLEIARSSELSAIELTEKLKLVPGLVDDWKRSAARGGARTALTLPKSHYPELSLDLVTSGIPECYDDGTTVDETAIRQSVMGYDQLCAVGTQLNVCYEAYALPESPSHMSTSISGAADAAVVGMEPLLLLPSPEL